MCRTSGGAAKISNVAFYFHLYLNHSHSSYYDHLGRLSIFLHRCPTNIHYLHNRQGNPLQDDSPISPPPRPCSIKTASHCPWDKLQTLAPGPEWARCWEPLSRLTSRCLSWSNPGLPSGFWNAILVLASGPLFDQNCLASLLEWLVLQGSAQISKTFPDYTS